MKKVNLDLFQTSLILGESNSFGCTRAIINNKCRFFQSRDVETPYHSKPLNLSQDEAGKLRETIMPLVLSIEQIIHTIFPDQANKLVGTENNQCRLQKGGIFSAVTIAREFVCQPHKDSRDEESGLSVVVKINESDSFQYHILPDMKPKGIEGK